MVTARIRLVARCVRVGDVFGWARSHPTVHDQPVFQRLAEGFRLRRTYLEFVMARVSQTSKGRNRKKDKERGTHVTRVSS